ncbi:hypothetical protein ACOJTA_12655 [Malaciobacter sp. WC5094]
MKQSNADEQPNNNYSTENREKQVKYNLKKALQAMSKNDYNNVEFYLKKNDKLNDKNSQFVLSSFYIEEKNDIKKGLKYLEKAANNGSLKAMENMAYIYKHGKYGLEQNHKKSFYWLAKYIDAKSQVSK